MAQTVTQVVKSTFLADTILFIRNDLRDNITDPISSTRPSGQKFVMTSYPERPVVYPIITVKMQNSSVPTRLGMGANVFFSTLTIEVRIWARTIVEREELAQDVINRVIDNSLPHTTTGSSSNVDLIGPRIESINDLDEEGKGGIHSRIVTLSYDYII